MTREYVSKSGVNLSSKKPFLSLTGELHPPSNTLFITHFEVDRDHRGEGHGSSALKEAEAIVCDAVDGVVNITICIGREGDAKQFLQANGYEGISIEDGGEQLEGNKSINTDKRDSSELPRR